MEIIGPFIKLDWVLWVLTAHVFKHLLVAFTEQA